MEGLDWDGLKQSTMDFVLISVINQVSNELDDELTNDQQEQLLNLIFNIMTNSLLPDARLYWNEAIFKKVEYALEKKSEKATNDILREMGFER